MAGRTRTELSLKQKVDLLKNSEGRNSRQLAEIYGIGKTQVQTILKRNREILDSFEGNSNPERKRQCVRTSNDDVNDLMWQWFQKIRSQNIPVSGPMMQEKALAIAKERNLSDFKASRGWLRSFKARHNIYKCTKCGRSFRQKAHLKTHLKTVQCSNETDKTLEETHEFSRKQERLNNIAEKIVTHTWVDENNKSQKLVTVQRKDLSKITDTKRNPN